MKTILITGASGFIGRSLVQEFSDRGYRVYAGLRKSSATNILSIPNVKALYLDLSDSDNMISVFKSKNLVFDSVIHCAGVTKTCKKALFHKVNYLYTTYFINALKESNALKGKFLYISSLAAFGPGDAISLEPLSEKQTPRPNSAYGKSKFLSEQFIKTESNLDYLIMRPTGVYGPGEEDYYQVYKTAKMGLEFYISTTKQAISFIHVDDLCRLIADATASPIINKSYFVSDMENYTSAYFNQLLKEELKKKTIKLVFPKALIKILAFISEKTACLFGKAPTLNTEKYHEISAKNWLCDSSELKTDFNFSPQFLLKEGLHETLKWYKQEGLL